MAYSIVTTNAKKKLLKARAGDATLPKIVGFVFGDGGVNESGDIIDVDDDQENLNNEMARYPYDSHEFLTEQKCRYTKTLTSGMLDNKELSEIGLYDEDGDLVIIRHFKAKTKESDLEMEFQVDNIY